MLIQFDVFDAKSSKSVHYDQLKIVNVVAFFVVSSFLFVVVVVVVVVILLKEFLKSGVKVYALFMHHINVSFFFLFLFFFFQAF